MTFSVVSPWRSSWAILKATHPLISALNKYGVFFIHSEHRTPKLTVAAPKTSPPAAWAARSTPITSKARRQGLRGGRLDMLRQTWYASSIRQSAGKARLCDTHLQIQFQRDAHSDKMNCTPLLAVPTEDSMQRIISHHLSPTNK